jgi:hypothetical protein
MRDDLRLFCVLHSLVPQSVTAIEPDFLRLEKRAQREGVTYVPDIRLEPQWSQADRDMYDKVLNLVVQAGKKRGVHAPSRKRLGRLAHELRDKTGFRGLK